MEVKIERLNDTGEGIGYVNKKIIFVPKVVIGDVVKIDDISEYKKYMRANNYSIVKSSDIRIKSLCPYFNECGGCQLMNMDYQEQINYKRDKVINIFKKYGNIDIHPDIIYDKQFKYRNKIILEVRNGKIGLFKYHSHDIVKIDKCFLMSDNINKIIKIINDNVNLLGVNKIMIRESTTKDIMVVFYGKIDKDRVKNILDGEVRSIYVNDKLISGDKYIKTRLGKYFYLVSPESFFQVNYDMTVKLYDKVLDYLISSDKVMDLYCGTGSIGIYIADKVKSIFGIEINKSAIRDANSNKELNDINNISFKCGDVENIINSRDFYDTIIVDPPRGGLSKKTKDILLDISSKKIIYVSCNPMTLVRDINDLKAKYEFREITLFDLFPNTYHVESVTLLSLKH